MATRKKRKRRGHVRPTAVDAPVSEVIFSELAVPVCVLRRRREKKRSPLLLSTSVTGWKGGKR